MGKMVHCKTCDAKIAASAKACPNCGAKNKKPIFKKWWFWTIVVIVILAVAGGGEEDQPTKVGDVVASNPVRSQNVQTEFKVGEVVELDDVYITLLSVTESRGENFLVPGDGKIFVICEFEIVNDSDAEISISSMMSFEAYADDYAVDVSISAMSCSDRNQLDGSVAAGKKMRGVVGYEVPADWEEFEIRYTPDYWSKTEIVFVEKK